MNNTKEFLSVELKKLVHTFKNVLCRYEFDSRSDAHYVEITPSEQYEEDAIRLKLAEIMYSFYDLFPTESLVFLTEDDSISLSNVNFTIRGEEYSSKWNCFSVTDEYLDFIQPSGENSYALAA